MASEPRGGLLPGGGGGSSSSLCFDREQFMKDGFDVDSFVAECKKHVQLEVLREDLEVYYKLLKSSMVELINKDYADFVNLSSNLVGMDKSLNQLRVPLGQLREEVLCVRSALNEVIQAFDDRLAKRTDIRKKKACLQRLMHVIRSVEKIEKILQTQGSRDGLSASDTNSVPLAGQTLERIATEFNQLQFYAVQSKGMPLLDNIRPRIAGITATLQHSLEGLLLEGLQAGDGGVVRQCLRTYATIDKTRDAEALVSQILVRPFVEEVVSEQYVQSHPQGLKGMYSKLLEFVPHHCRLLKEVTMGTLVSGERTEVVHGYDFPVNSVWPEMVRCLEQRLSSIFNAGNPDVFHEKYNVSMEFVSAFERQCASQASVRRLRAHAAYESFSNKWSLSVFFQIRFKELVENLESALHSGLQPAPADSEFRLHATHGLWMSLQRCWADPVYLPPLAHRFWKVTLQMLARYAIWMQELLEPPAPDPHDHPRREGGGLKPSQSTPGFGSMLQQHQHQHEPHGAVNAYGGAGVKRSPSVQSLGGEENHTGRTASDVSSSKAPSCGQLASVVGDSDRIQKKLEDFLQTVIKPRLDLLGFKDYDSLSGALAESRAALEGAVPACGTRITGELAELCSGCLRGAQEVPRLYRRTNKDAPSRPSPYVENALRPLEQMLSEHTGAVEHARLHAWILDSLRKSTERYHETVSDVLTSVRKMEESLKRLKQARKTGAGATAAAAAASGTGLTDDDKIRLQLYLDTQAFRQQIEKLGVEASEIPTLQSLIDTVQTAKALVTTESIS
ncbi:conserved oligomeric Golgi complex subunit 2 [Lethenteron reissneri]|uniref:conserved oligomeric Golgi complex subunit 2 n=1 Tax=Lethenteron reissneri TaxID=7753 RepID=UPI002AB7D384|nr:conserved oligomeric Golgi complex subunit 2 [Lethenteron reissneri]